MRRKIADDAFARTQLWGAQSWVALTECRTQSTVALERPCTLARRASQHALPLYLEILGLPLTVTCACWWTLRRNTAPRGESTALAPRLLPLRIAIGLP